MMSHVIWNFLLVTLFLLQLVQVNKADGWDPRTFRKRISDQRLAELEAMMHISKMRRPVVAFGIVDPRKAGKREVFSPLQDYGSWLQEYEDKEPSDK